MSIAALVHRCAFGLKGDVSHCLSYLDEQTLVYPAGHNVILYNTEQKTQKFIPGTEKSEGVTCLCISPNKRYVAIAERDERALITIYDLHSLRRRKVLSTAECGSKEFVSMAFSPDSKYLITQGGAPDWTLLYWGWDKAKVLASIKTTNANNAPLYQALFNPQDNAVVSVVGNGIYKLFRYADGVLRQLSGTLVKPLHYLAHSWLTDERVVAGTEEGELILFEMGEFKAILPQPPVDGLSVDCIVPYTKGFICGGDNGIVGLYEKTDDKDYYTRAKVFHIPDNDCKVTSVCVTPMEESLACALANNQLFSLPIVNTDILKSDESVLEPLAQPFHRAKITGLDVCIRKPICATCSTDRSVRVWNYQDRSAEIVKQFPEEAHSIALHPSGLHVAVGFTDKLKLMNLLMEDIRPYREFPIRSCREVRFSNGGQYFAAANGNTVQIFSTYTFDNLGNLRGHNGKVQCVSWSRDDTRLVTSGMDGAVYEWVLADFKREGENVIKSCQYTSTVLTPDAKTIFTVGNDKKLKEISDSVVIREFDTGVTLTQIVLSHAGRMFFAATEHGTVRAYKYPLTGEYQEHQCHLGAVTRLALSRDDSLLFSVGEDGSLYICDVRDRERAVKSGDEIIYSEEVLVTKSDIEEKTARMAELRTEVEDLTLKNDYQLRLKDLTYQEKLKEVTEKFNQDLEAGRTRYEVLAQEKSDMEVEYEEKLKALKEKHQEEIAELEAAFQSKIMGEVVRYRDLVGQKDSMDTQWESKYKQMLEAHKAEVAALRQQYEEKLGHDKTVLQHTLQQREEALREFEETKRQLEEDADHEIEDLKERFEQKLAVERRASLQLKGENGIMKKKYSALKKDIEDHKSDMAKQIERERLLETQRDSLEKDILGLKKEIKERDETISDKEKRIYELKKKNQELEKFKFVLDYKIKELKRQMEPREVEVGSMKQQIKDMDSELEKYHSHNSSLKMTIGELRLKSEGMAKELASQRTKLQDAALLLERFRRDLHKCMPFIQDPKVFKEKIKEVYEQHVKSVAERTSLETDVRAEYQRQREHLESSATALKKKLNKDKTLHTADSLRIMQENVALINEINILRREIKLLKDSQRTQGLTQAAQRARRSGLPTGSPRQTPRTPGRGDTGAEFTAEAARMLDMQREEIRRLREQIQRIEEGPVQGQTSVGVLPPFD
eukprot:GCRY01003467.1.p1 GENE.GCRY01003467.1~~GCRY01003467.1.p1  ORF type:complete len:1179 (+),score=364.32 GCRY01003467.1:161-3697(+)